jgi:hypothetical protein
MLFVEHLWSLRNSMMKEEFWRPAGVLICGMMLWNLPTVLYKIRLIINAVAYFFCCWDRSWVKPVDPGSVFGPHLSRGLPVQRKRIYFIRHGESTWNETFNKGAHRSLSVFAVGFIPGLIKAILYETYFFLTGKMDRYIP